jgi:DNA-binding FrmR family transcriptional regulator
MPHSPEDKKRVLVRLKRIRGQVEALERAVLAGTDCTLLLQQIAAFRGAAGGLMAEVLDIHLADSLGPDAAAAGDLDAVMKILRTYLK